MPKRDPDLLIEDMLASMRKIERYTSGMDQELPEPASASISTRGRWSKSVQP
jgi:uncharacterized protein with HEPN domain